MLLEIAPQVLDWIQLGSVRREPFDLAPLAMFPYEIGNLSAPMGRQAIPDHQQRTWQLPQKATEKVDHLWTADRAGVETEVKIPPGYPRDRRERFPVEMELEDGGVTTGRPGSAAMGPLA